MTTISIEPGASSEKPQSLIAAMTPHLPRMAAVTGVALAATLLAIQLIPQTFEARLPLAVSAGSTPEADASRFLTEAQLADVISRLSPERVAELRANGAGNGLDSTAILRQRLKLIPDAAGTGLNMTVTASSAALARTVADAAAISFATLAAPPPALAAAPMRDVAAEADAPAADESPAETAVAEAATVDATYVQLLQQKLSFAWEDRVRLDARAERIASLVEGGNYALLAMEADGLPALGRKLDQLAGLEAAREELAITLLPAHPNMRAVVDQIGALSDEVSAEVESLVALTRADSDAARALEEGLRTELAAITAPKLVDTDIMTGAIDPLPEAKVTALPRPIRTDLALALVGGLAFFGQVGVFAVRRGRSAPHDDIEPVEETALDATPEEAWQPAAPEPQPTAEAPRAAEPFWLAEVRAQTSAVNASWLAPTAEPEAVAKPVAPVAPAKKDKAERKRAAKAQPDLAERLAQCRVVALRSETMAGRDLVADMIKQGRRVVLIDAASRRRTTAPGISDLSVGLAGFADIIHGSGLYEAAHIPWGRQAEFDPAARPVRILVQALSELYDVVVLVVANSPANSALLDLADEVVEPTDIAAMLKRSA